MSKSASSLRRPSSAGLKRKELPGNRSCMLRIGERLMRAGSEGNLVHKPKATPERPQEPPESSGFTVLEVNSSFGLVQRKHQDDSVLHSNPELSSSSGVAPSSPDKKLGILEHLRQKYPQRAAIILGQHDEPGEEVRSPPPPGCCVDALTSAEDLERLACESMSDREAPPMFVSFSRGTKTRASLPTHSRERTLGVLYLQYGEETKQVLMPSAVSSVDTLRALFVTAFPHQLTMKRLQSPNMAICIKDTNRNVYYNLEDVRNITPHSCLKAYHKEPEYVFNSLHRPTTTERISKELLYSIQSPVHALQGSMSPPTVRSMPSSPCRRSSNGAASQTRGSASMEPDSNRSRTSQEQALFRSGSLSSGSSAILERRDVRPDEDRGSSTSLALIVRSDGGLQLPESFTSSLQEGARVRLSTSSQCSAPPSLPAELRMPAGLQQYRASIKPLTGYGDGAEHQSSSLHRQKSRKYSENQQSPLRTQTPPLSPQRQGGNVGHPSLDRMSPFRRSLQRDSSGALVEVISRRRGSGSSSSTSSVFLDNPLGQPDGLVEGHVTVGNVQSVRMKAMEEQIASLAGLVHHALSIGPEAAGAADAVSESSASKLCSRTGFLSESSGISTASFVTNTDPELQQRLLLAKRNVSELRVQLVQLRNLQMLNQQSVSSMLQTTAQKLRKLICEQQTASKPRAEMEQQRIHFLQTEETILTQLGELEDFVEGLIQPAVTLKDVEEGAMNLRRVGETLAKLKGDFPGLQVKMRSVLRPEVEAVRFLKDEPHKMDSMLRRVRTLTETLSALRRSVSESSSAARSVHVEPVRVLDDTQIPSQTRSPQISPKPQTRIRQDQNPSSHLCTNGAPTLLYGRDSPTVVKVSPRSREGSPNLQRKPEPQQNQNSSTMSQDGSRHHSTKADRASLSSTSQEESRAKLQNQNTPTVTSVCEYDVWIPREITVHTDPPETDRDTERALQASLQQTPAGENLRGGAPGVREKVEDSKAASSQLPPKDCGPSSASPTKPRRAVKQSSDGAAKSSPSPPPRRVQSTSPAPTTETVYSSRTPPVGDQDKGRNEKQLPQPKPPRQPPEVKPKPQTFARTPPTAASGVSSAPGPTLQDPQVESELSAKNHLSGEMEKKSEGKTKNSLISDKTQLRRVDEVKEHLKLKLDKKKVELGLFSEKTILEEKEEKPPPVTSRTNPSDVKKPANKAGNSQMKKDSVLSPTSAEKKVKVTTIVTLQKENHQEAPTSPKKTHLEAEKKSNVTVVVTLQKDNILKDPLTRSSSVPHENVSVNSGQENPVPKFSSSIHSSEPQREEYYVKIRDSSPCSEEGGTLSPNDEGPPPPPPQIGKFKQKRSKARTRFKSEDERTKMDGQDIQPDEVDLSTENGNQEPKDFEVDENLKNEPIIVILNEPIDLQMAYKRLSTIFESEEDLTGAPLKIWPERKISQERKISSGTTDEESKKVQDEQKSASPKTKSSPLVQQGKLSADPVLVLEDKKKPDSPKKAEEKRKFKFKFSKNKLASISQAIRPAKKTLELVVYEEEEDMKADRNTKNRTKAPTSVEISSSKAEDVKASLSKSHTRVEELKKSTFDTISSLEESIKQLEISVDDIGSPSPGSPPSPLDSTHRGPGKSRVSRERERSPSKRPAPTPPKGPNPPQNKKARPQPGRDPVRTPTRRQTSNSSSSALRSHPKTHHSTSSSSPEKTSRTQSSESNKTSGADPSVPPNAQRISKIPALFPTAAQKLLRKPASSPPLAKAIPPSQSFIPSLSLRRLLPSSYRLTSPPANGDSAHHSGKDPNSTSSCSTPSSSSAAFIQNSPRLRRK